MDLFKYTILSISLFVAFIITVDAQATVIDLTTKGAKPNSDISQILLDAWQVACAAPTATKILIPAGNYNLGQVKLVGPCKAPVELQLDGVVKAPVDPNLFKEKDVWLTFEKIDQLKISGKGSFDGQGESAWKANDCHKNTNCLAIINLRFNFVTNSLVTGVTTLNSKNFHVNVLGCENLTFDHFIVSAPGTSINTDGIHIGRSKGINIINTDIKTGDDCISMGDGCKDINITGVTCGPGHGISVGSLGRYDNEEPVSGITVTNCTITGTDNGVRIKSWPDSRPGVAENIHFKDIVVKDVRYPIVLDQVYCPYNQCNAKVPSKVKLSNISFKNIRGTSADPLAVKLVCSSGFPCQNVEIGDIDITYSGNLGAIKSECSNMKPIFSGKQVPAITCA